MPFVCIAGFVPGVDQNPSVIDPYLAMEAATTTGGGDMSLRAIEHIGQNIRDGAFRHYDYGPQENLERYESEVPPLIPFENIEVPIALFFAEYDNIVSELDREHVIQDFGDNVVHSEVYPVNHSGLGVDNQSNRQLVMDAILSVLDNYQ